MGRRPHPGDTIGAFQIAAVDLSASRHAGSRTNVIRFYLGTFHGIGTYILQDYSTSNYAEYFVIVPQEPVKEGKWSTTGTYTGSIRVEAYDTSSHRASGTFAVRLGLRLGQGPPVQQFTQGRFAGVIR